MSTNRGLTIEFICVRNTTCFYCEDIRVKFPSNAVNPASLTAVSTSTVLGSPSIDNKREENNNLDVHDSDQNTPQLTTTDDTTTEALPIRKKWEKPAHIDVVDMFCNEAKTDVIGIIGLDYRLYFYDVISGDYTSTPTHEILQQFGLKKGRNIILSRHNTTGTIRFFSIWLYDYTDRLAVIDIDGTITKSDFTGYFQTVYLKVYTYIHEGVVEFLNALETNHGIHMIYLTSRPQAHRKETRSMLEGIRDSNGKGMTLPDGPLFTNSDDVLTAAFKEVVLKSGLEYKSTSLLPVINLFKWAGSPAVCPFVLGLGNRESDARAYNISGLSADSILLIDADSNIKVWKFAQLRKRGAINKRQQQISTKEAFQGVKYHRRDSHSKKVSKKAKTKIALSSPEYSPKSSRSNTLTNDNNDLIQKTSSRTNQFENNTENDKGHSKTSISDNDEEDDDCSIAAINGDKQKNKQNSKKNKSHKSYNDQDGKSTSTGITKQTSVPAPLAHQSSSNGFLRAITGLLWNNTSSTTISTTNANDTADTGTSNHLDTIDADTTQRLNNSIINKDYASDSELPVLRRKSIEKKKVKVKHIRRTLQQSKNEQEAAHQNGILSSSSSVSLSSSTSLSQIANDDNKNHDDSNSNMDSTSPEPLFNRRNMMVKSKTERIRSNNFNTNTRSTSGDNGTIGTKKQYGNIILSVFSTEEDVSEDDDDVDEDANYNDFDYDEEENPDEHNTSIVENNPNSKNNEIHYIDHDDSYKQPKLTTLTTDLAIIQPTATTASTMLGSVLPHSSNQGEISIKKEDENNEKVQQQMQEDVSIEDKSPSSQSASPQLKQEDEEMLCMSFHTYSDPQLLVYIDTLFKYYNSKNNYLLNER